MTDLAIMEQDDLVARIKESVRSGERAENERDEHFREAGRYLKALKEHKPDGVRWSEFVHETCGLRQSRADELIRMAEGRTTAAKVRAGNAARMRKSRRKSASRDTDEGQDDAPRSAAEHEEKGNYQPHDGSRVRLQRGIEPVGDGDRSVEASLLAIEHQTTLTCGWLASMGSDRWRSIAKRLRTCGDELLSAADNLEEQFARKGRPQRQVRRAGRQDATEQQPNPHQDEH